ncbi:MAG: hypothetical protein RLZZ211_437 [Bacteroidota bacterium]|jgi:hypothetical protein
MSIGMNLSKEGFSILKKDRQEIMKQIEELNNVLYEFDYVYPFLESIFEPKVSIRKDNGIYFGSFPIHYPTLEEPIIEEFEIGKVSDFNTNGNPSHHDEANKIMLKIIKGKFPLHFSDND